MASGYPPQNYQPPGYAPAPQHFKADNPPPYGVPPHQPVGYAPAPVPQQQTSNNVVVVNSQPTPVIATTTIRPVGDHFLTLSIILTILCFICGTWHALLCTIPAIIFSTMARDAEARGDMESARTHSHISLGCNIGGLVSNVVAIVVLIILVVVLSSASSNSDNYYCYYSNYYSYYRCYYN